MKPFGLSPVALVPGLSWAGFGGGVLGSIGLRFWFGSLGPHPRIPPNASTASNWPSALKGKLLIGEGELRQGGWPDPWLGGPPVFPGGLVAEHIGLDHVTLGPPA